jgi:oligoendopeptidase F
MWKDRLYQPDFTPAEFSSLLGDLIHIEETASKLYCFASLSTAMDTSNQRFLSFQARISELLAELQNATIFFELWWKDLPEERIGPFLEAVPEHEYFLKRLRDFKPYSLSEPEEKILNFKDITGAEAFRTLYDTYTNRYRFQSHFDPEAGGKILTREELSVYVRSPVPAEREGAYRELYRVFSEDGPILGQIYQALVRDWRVDNVRLRGYPSSQSARNLRNDLKDEDVLSLLRVCQEEIPKVFGKYFQEKAAFLKVPKLRRYDLYAPLISLKEPEIPFEEGLKLVAEAYADFSPKLSELALKVSQERHLSARILPGKQSGAFCQAVLPEEVPWVLMTYNGRRRDLFTLAHELGHAVHFQMAEKRGILEYHASLPMCETASTFGEMLLMRFFLKNEKDPEKKADLLFHLLDDAYATVARQAFFALFEVEAHDLVDQGATVADLKDAYFRNLQRQFGDNVMLSPEFAWEWVLIPHFFHTPFYVYAYSFGQLLVYSLWNVYEKEGEAFVPKFLHILERGGSASAATILAEVGSGPLDDNFWRGGFRVIQGFLDTLTALR